MKKWLSCILCVAAFMGIFATSVCRACESPDLGEMHYIDSVFIKIADSNIGLDITDAIQVRITWDVCDGDEVVDAEIWFPIVPEDIAMVIITDGVSIAQGQWDLTSGHSLHAYFYKHDLEQFIGKEAVYLVMLRFKDGLYFNIY